uniref:Uncharacterized protein n=1 Tax=Anguilla anguilla TaxID=7936 RepID=A0A0E9PLZ2_ANGAN
MDLSAHIFPPGGDCVKSK